MHSPPFDEIKDNKTYKNKTGYMISKYGMTMTEMAKKVGVSKETISKKFKKGEDLLIWLNRGKLYKN